MNNSDLSNGDDDDVVEVTSDPSCDARKKLEALREHLPFITQVIKIYDRQLSRDQFRKLEMLSQLLQRKRVSLQTLTKIERVVHRLQVQFNGIRKRYAKSLCQASDEREANLPNLQNSDSDVIDISDDVEPASTSRATCNRPQPARQSPKTGPPTERLWNRIRSKNIATTSSGKNVKLVPPHSTTTSDNQQDKPAAASLATDKSRKSTSATDNQAQTTSSSTSISGAPTLEEARKKLAALRGHVLPASTAPAEATLLEETPVEATSPKTPSPQTISVPAVQHTSPTPVPVPVPAPVLVSAPVLASNCNDPRGRKPNYTSIETSSNNNNNQMDSLNPRQALAAISLLEDTPPSAPRPLLTQPNSPPPAAPPYINTNVRPAYRPNSSNLYMPEQRAQSHLKTNGNNIVINTKMPAARPPAETSHNAQHFNRATAAAEQRPHINVGQRYSAGDVNSSSSSNDFAINKDPRRFSATGKIDTASVESRKQLNGLNNFLFHNNQTNFNGPQTNFNGPNKQNIFNGPQNQRNFNGPNNQTNFNGPKNQLNFNGPQNQSNIICPNTQTSFNAPQNQTNFNGPNNQNNFNGPKNQNNFNGPNNPSTQQQRYPSDPRRQHVIVNCNVNNANEQGNNSGFGNGHNMPSNRDEVSKTLPSLLDWQPPSDNGFCPMNGGAGAAWSQNKNISFNGPYRGGSGFRGRAPGRGGTTQPTRFQCATSNATQSTPSQTTLPPTNGNLPRTYREHREAKARAEAEAAKARAEAEAAKAKILQQHNKFLEENASGKSAESETEKPPAESFQLDTSYRTVTLDALPKKISFKIPKKVDSSKAAVDKEKEKEKETNADDAAGGAASAAAGKGKVKEDTVKNKEQDKEKDNKGKHEKEKEGETAASKSTAAATPLNPFKNEHITVEKCQKTANTGKIAQKATPKSLPQAESVQSERKAKPAEDASSLEEAGKQAKPSTKVKPDKGKPTKAKADKAKHESTIETQTEVDEQQRSEDENDEIVAQGWRKRSKQQRKISSDTEADELDNAAKVAAEVEAAKPMRKTDKLPNVEKKEKENLIETEAEAEPPQLASEPPAATQPLPKLSKLKIVLGPNARTEVIPSSKPSSQAKGGQVVKRTLTFKDDVKPPQSPDKPPTGQAEPSRLVRIMSRRASMASTASKPMLDKNELLPSKSLLYEDLHEELRKTERVNKSLATMFEKTSDNCSVSTQNIITGKRRTRLQEPTLNETQLCRTAFKMSDAKAEQKPRPCVDSTAQASSEKLKRKRGRPSKEKSQPTQEQDLPEPKRPRLCVQPEVPAKVEPTAPAVVNKPIIKRRPKRNELDKLNEDIAAMYCGDDVLRASGRRACTQIHAPPVLASHEDSGSEKAAKYNDIPLLRNMARRGRPFRRSQPAGLDRAAVQLKQMKLKQCRVRIKRCEVPEPPAAVAVAAAAAAAAVAVVVPALPLVKNNRSDWHACSSAIDTCVVCLKTLKRPLSHYLQSHGELYAARFPPGVLAELRASRLNRPLYVYNNLHYHTCPFCLKVQLINSASWSEHLARHTGEVNYQCSKCLSPQHRPNKIAKHVAACGAGAKIQINNYYTTQLPLLAHVCHLCEFVQLSKSNMQRHYERHHDCTTANKLPKECYSIVLYKRDGAPKIKTESEANALRRKYKLNMPAVLKQATSRVKPELLDAEMAVQPESESESETMDSIDDQLHTDINGDALLVVNECKLEPPEDELLTDECVPLALLEKELANAAEPPIASHSKANAWGPKDLSADLLEDNLSGIGSVDSDDSVRFLSDYEVDMLTKATAAAAAAAVEAEEAAAAAVPEIATAVSNAPADEWVDLESANSTTSTKTIFQKFNKFYSKFNSKSSSSASSRKQVKSKDTNSTCSDSDSISVEPEQRPAPEQSAVPAAAGPAWTTVQNVAYRERSAAAIAYYCMYAGCNFLFSNEQEGLENHFASEHPTARWSGRCKACQKQVLPVGDYLIKLELGHMVSMHMPAQAASDTTAELVTPPSASPALAKLRVRRFTGDRLMSEESAPTVQDNIMLRGLLSSEPRPLTQQTDLNAAGLGEFLCAKSPETSLTAATTPTVVNHQSGLGLAIGNVFSLNALPNELCFGSSAPLEPAPLAAQTVTLPPTTSGDFVLTQSFSQSDNGYGQGEMPVAQVNISIVPVAASNQLSSSEASTSFCCMASRCGYRSPRAMDMRQHLATHMMHKGSSKYLRCCYCKHVAKDLDEYISHGVREHKLDTPPPQPQPQPPVDMLSEQIRSVLSQRQNGPQSASAVGSNALPSMFRCMAPKCGFQTPTIFRIRQHMSFHRLGFSHNEYLRCSYCTHTANDVHSYITHGITDHNLASQAEMDEYQQAQVVGGSQNLPPQLVSFVGRDDQLSPVNAAVRALLAPTGLVAAKLYACPLKGCNTSLNEDTFLNHVMFHLSSGGSNVNCKHCGEAYDRPSQLRVHLQRRHARHKFICGICIATTVNQRLMVHHVRSQHGEEYQLVNCQLRYMLLSSRRDGDNEAGAAGSSRSSSSKAAGDDQCYLCIVEQPFGQRQLNEFLHALLDEHQQRSSGTKRIYRSSEVRSLPRQPWYTREVYCGDCVYSTAQRMRIRCHLEMHLASAMRTIYGVGGNENPDPDSLDKDELQPEDLIDVATLASFSSMAATKAAKASTLAIAPAPAPAPAAVAAAAAADVAVDAAGSAGVASSAAVQPRAEPQPGRHIVVMPSYAYVPEDNRYYCGIGKCNGVLPTERLFREHLTQQHSYGSEYACTHCNKVLRGYLNVESVLQHLRYHQQHLYQCGACEHFHYKRINIERHILDKHVALDVDVIIHKREETYAMLGLTRWIKPTRPLATQDDFVCNMCQQTEPTFPKMLDHVKVHGERRQYSCPYCEFDAHAAVNVTTHILESHPNERVQPKQVFQRVKGKGRLTLCFHCNLCPTTANIFQRMTMHCLEKHQCRNQYKCPHCPLNHFKERTIMSHILQDHPQLVGLAVMQFDRVMNEMLDADSWQQGNDLAGAAELQLPAAKKPTAPLTANVNDDEIEIISSDSEEDGSQHSDCSEDNGSHKMLEFICSHCHESCADIDEMRTEHWTKLHKQLPFYFGVQPQLRCPQCQHFTGNAKKLLDHLLTVHHIRNLVASDTRQPDECAFCEHKYKDWAELAQHIVTHGHLSNDLKHLSQEDLDNVLKLGISGINEYYQCTVCSIVMPTQVAMARHGSVEHPTAAERFCFRRLTDQVVYHCSFCMFAATSEPLTLRHMLEHNKRFRYCNFCQQQQMGGFDEYIQHCYEHHRTELHKIRDVHTFAELKKFFTQMLCQFKNGLVISKSSLRHTSHNGEANLLELYEEMMSKALQPPIPRIAVSELLNRNGGGGGGGGTGGSSAGSGGNGSSAGSGDNSNGGSSNGNGTGTGNSSGNNSTTSLSNINNINSCNRKPNKNNGNIVKLSNIDGNNNCSNGNQNNNMLRHRSNSIENIRGNSTGTNVKHNTSKPKNTNSSRSQHTVAHLGLTEASSSQQSLLTSAAAAAAAAPARKITARRKTINPSDIQHNRAKASRCPDGQTSVAPSWFSWVHALDDINIPQQGTGTGGTVAKADDSNAAAGRRLAAGKRTAADSKTGVLQPPLEKDSVPVIGFVDTTTANDNPIEITNAVTTEQCDPEPSGLMLIRKRRKTFISIEQLRAWNG